MNRRLFLKSLTAVSIMSFIPACKSTQQFVQSLQDNYTLAGQKRGLAKKVLLIDKLPHPNSLSLYTSEGSDGYRMLKDSMNDED
jgi:hypothetical protein